MSEPVAPGRVLAGRYRLIGLIARGGMASVWEAEDPLLSRRVAIKILDRGPADDDALRARFRHEAVAAARLAHPNIVATYDTGEDDGDAYIVMELVAGRTLRELVDAHGAVAVGEAVDFTMQIAAALAHAHAHGIIHRDVKPGNVLVQADGHVRVTDFGIAKATDSGSDLTRAGTVMGTARYLAPEQVRNGNVDARADVYSLALVLYELLVGQAPFAADSDVATAVARLTNDPPSVRASRPEIPPALDAAIAAALVRDPGGRTPTARAFRDDLAAAMGLDAPPPPDDLTRPVAAVAAVPAPVVVATVPAPRRRKRSPALLVFGFILLFLAGAAIGYFAFRAIDENSTTGANPPTTTTPTPTPLAISSVEAFDPGGGDGENDADAINVITAGANRGWSTEAYADANMRPKDGVGLQFALASSASVRGVKVSAEEGPWSASVYTSDRAFDTVPSGTAAARGTGLGTDATLTLDPTQSARFVVLWITELPRTGSDDNPYRLTIEHVEIVG